MGLLKKRHHQPIQALQSKNRNGLPTAFTDDIDQSKLDATNFATQAALAMFSKPSSSSKTTPTPTTSVPVATKIPTVVNVTHDSQPKISNPVTLHRLSIPTSPSIPSSLTPKLPSKRTSSHIKRSISTNSNLSVINSAKRNINSNVPSVLCGSPQILESNNNKNSLMDTKNKQFSTFEPIESFSYLKDDAESEDYKPTYPTITITRRTSHSLANSAANLAVQNMNSNEKALSGSPFSKPPVIPGIESHSGSPKSQRSDYFPVISKSIVPSTSYSLSSSLNSYVSSGNAHSTESFPNQSSILSTTENQQVRNRARQQVSGRLEPNASNSHLDPAQNEDQSSSIEDVYDAHFPGPFEGFDNHYYYIQRPRSIAYSSRSNSYHREESQLENDFHKMHLTLNSKLGWNDSTISLQNGLDHDILMKSTASLPQQQEDPPIETQSQSVMAPIPTIKVLHPKSIKDGLKLHVNTSQAEIDNVLFTPEDEEVPFKYHLPNGSTVDPIVNVSPRQLSTENISNTSQTGGPIRINHQRIVSGKLVTRKPPPPPFSTTDTSASLSLSSPSTEPVPIHLPHPKSILNQGNGLELTSKYATTSSFLHEFDKNFKRSTSPRRKPPPLSPTSTPAYTDPHTYIASSELEEADDNGNYETDDSIVLSDYEENLPQFPELVKLKARHLRSTNHRVHSSFSTSKKIKAITDPHYSASDRFKRNTRNIFRRSLKSTGSYIPASPATDNHETWYSPRHSESRLSTSYPDTSAKAGPMYEEPVYPIPAPIVKQNTVQFRTTMRKEKKTDKVNEEKPWKQHNDRHYITDQEKKRYQGLWASNKGLYFQYLDIQTIEKLRIEKAENNMNPALAASQLSAAANSNGSNDNNMDSHTIKGQILEDEFKSTELMLNIVVRDLWGRSKLPNDLLMQIYELVDVRKDGFLDKKSFVVGMWLVDQCLFGRKLPKFVTQDLWNSAVMNFNVLIKNKKRK